MKMLRSTHERIVDEMKTKLIAEREEKRTYSRRYQIESIKRKNLEQQLKAETEKTESLMGEICELNKELMELGKKLELIRDITNTI